MITYEDYLARFDEQYGNNSEGGTNTPFDEATWNAMSQQEKFNNLQGGFNVAPGDARYEELAAATGAEPGRLIRVIGGDPTRDPNFELVDPSKYVRGEGWGAYAENNQTPGMQRGEEEKWNWVALAAPIVTAGIGSALGAYGGAAGMVDPLAAAPGQGFGTASAGGAASTAAGASTVTPGNFGEGSPGWTAEGGPPPAATPAPTPAPTPSSGGIINGARGAWNSATGWYNGLSAGSRAVLGLGVSQGINGLVRANAQQEASDAIEDRDERAREDRIRRTNVGNFGGAFTPKPKGIIDSRRNGG